MSTGATINDVSTGLADLGGACDEDADCISSCVCAQDKCARRNATMLAAKEGLSTSESRQVASPRQDSRLALSPSSSEVTSGPSAEPSQPSSCAANGECLAETTCVDGKCISKSEGNEICDDDIDCLGDAKCVNDKCAKQKGLSKLEIAGIVAGIITSTVIAIAAVVTCCRRVSADEASKARGIWFSCRVDGGAITDNH
eukprot:Plantae.Rhodophyta-Hildenbrandia_rubra.ctg10190.p1 GENE.Plantae.Rhodophyta-Hildenbrandia_rubra.ctg10190~~Plantae.Rhodophyta-Hildenbrandia_rubra.ctg10190.p1  ORF type:complete len:199 (+),score=33.64 Plantae.Rhodophyta-Hildenbrandia_rubra.ctg10190:149-745(+)